MARALADEPKEVQTEFLRIAAGYALPIFWGSDGDISHNGTAFILNTGKRTFGVTAAHVYNEYLHDYRAGTVNVCQFGELQIPMQERLISIGTKDWSDIATIELTPTEIAKCSSKVLTGDQKSWPPSPPKIGQAAVVAGYPGGERIQVAKYHFSFGTACFNTPVSSVSENQFICAFERDGWIDLFGKGLPRVNFNLAGISGAPAITLIQTDTELAVWRLAGVVYQAVASDMIGEILVVNHARLIGPNGEVHDHT